jgi:cysteine desulfurase
MLDAVGGQEFGYRPGTQNVPAALGFAAAAESAAIGFQDFRRHRGPMAKWLWGIEQAVAEFDHQLESAGGRFQPDGRENGDAPRCGWIWALTMPRVSAAAQLIRFDGAGISVSAGSACSSGSLKPSRALAAFGVPKERATCTIRVSIGWSTTAGDLAAFKETWLDMASDAASRAA